MSEGTSSFNPAKRRLCPDGACIGVIGDDGRCRVCGTSVGAAGASAAAGTTASNGFGNQAYDDDRDGDGDGDGYGDGQTSNDPVVHDGDADRAASGNGVGVDPYPTAGAAGPAGVRADSGFRPDRRLCDDGSCIGVVGADGLCGVCGRRAV
jgi:hypothetical protein